MQSDIDAPIRSLDGPEYIEVDGQMVPNYDVTMPVFDEGDVVSGRVVRIDKDEVLVDIGYKSEGVIPVGELSIRKSVNTEEEVSLGEVVDAITTLWTECPSPDLTDGRSTRDHITEYLDTMADLMRSDRAGLVFTSVMATATTNPELVHRYQQVAIEPRREQLRDILRHGMATGELRSDLDLELIVRMLASPIVQMAKTECLGEPLPEGFVERLVDAALRGIAG